MTYEPTMQEIKDLVETKLLGKSIPAQVRERGIVLRNLSGKIDKGFVGTVAEKIIEHELGLKLKGSEQVPDLKDGDLKTPTYTLRANHQGYLVDQSIAVTMLDSIKKYHSTSFLDSHAAAKTTALVVPSVIRGNEDAVFGTPFIMSPENQFDIYAQIDADYRMILENLLKKSTPAKLAFAGGVGNFMQSRTKGRGNGHDKRTYNFVLGDMAFENVTADTIFTYNSRAFYLRPGTVALIHKMVTGEIDQETLQQILAEPRIVKNIGHLGKFLKARNIYLGHSYESLVQVH